MNGCLVVLIIDGKRNGVVLTEDRDSAIREIDYIKTEFPTFVEMIKVGKITGFKIHHFGKDGVLSSIETVANPACDAISRRRHFD